ncbi:MAG: hypothetical protein ACK2VA_22310 [Anaerolineae bacterium]
MHRAEPFALDEAIRAEADQILWERGLHRLLAQYGKVHPAGSYALRLMVWRDLDLYLVAPGIPVAAFFRLGRRIAELLDAPKMHYRDERVGRTPGLPRDGLYWGVYLGDERAGAWKIDLWAIDEEEHDRLQAYQDAIEERLDVEARYRILRIKSAVWTRPGYRLYYSSQDIYQAVLDCGVADEDAFGAYLREHKGYGLDGRRELDV